MELSLFLEASLIKLQPLLDYDELLQRWKTEFDDADEERKSNNGKDRDNLFCKACNKLFSKETVYQSHLSGKKHKKNASQQKPDNFVSSLPWLEYLIGKLCQVLAPDLEYTRAQVEKLSNLSERELQLERQVQHDIENEFVAINNELDEDDLSGNEHDNDDDDDHLDNSFKNLPLGPDGTPIPFWLYKLQGLHKQYNCEICGNISYKGKTVFLKHFSGPKHQYGLKCLGVDEKNMKMFKNITKIDEATELWKVLRKETKLKTTELENSVEVEDKEGNVMSEKDYMDLKKQGLL